MNEPGNHSPVDQAVRSITDDGDQQPWEPPRLLSVDDASDSAELITRIAERCGFECWWTTNPSDVSNIVLSWQPRIIVTDICMPEMDAIELFTNLNRIEFSGDLVIVSGQDEVIRQQANKMATINRLKTVANMQKPLDVRKFRDFLGPYVADKPVHQGV